METAKVLQADYLDIIFENRNKVYGGYELLKNYTRRIKKAGLFAFLGIGSFVLFSFIATHSNGKNNHAINTGGVVITDIMLPELPKEQILPPKPTTPPPPPAPTKVFTVPIITDELINADAEMPKVEELAHASAGLSNSKGDSTFEGSMPGTGTRPVVAHIIEPPAPAVFTVVEQMPEFNGDLSKYLSANVQYPEPARNGGIEGRVAIQFVVNEDGAITDVKLTRGIGGGCDEEALRVIKSMPKWKPGKNNGKHVKVYYTQAISFRLN